MRSQTRKRRGGGVLTKPQHTLLKKVLTKMNPERRTDVYVSIYELMDAINAAKRKNSEAMTIQEIKDYVESKMFSPDDSAWDMRQDERGTTLIRYAAPPRAYYHGPSVTRRRRR